MIMLFGVMVVLLRLVRNSPWLMFMLHVRMGQSKGCGIRFQRDCNPWGEEGCASAAISMQLNLLMNEGRLGLDPGFWIMSPSVVS
jgi:hypothetical protein